MITPETITRKQARKLVILLERETRCEIMARFGRFDNLEFAEYAKRQQEYKDKIREKLFGTSNILELGERWGMIKKHKKKYNRKTSE